jgi:hypothetical protein
MVSAAAPWQVQDELVFSLPDQLVERCHDMTDLVQVAPRRAAPLPSPPHHH